MCSVCLSTPCLNGCPNAPDPVASDYCIRCKNPIYPEEEYGVIKGKAYCEPCLEDMPISELITLMGGDWLIAEVEEVCHGF